MESAGSILLFTAVRHTVVGGGNAVRAIDAGNKLRPMLARGELHCIEAATLDKNRNYTEMAQKI